MGKVAAFIIRRGPNTRRRIRLLAPVQKGFFAMPGEGLDNRLLQLDRLDNVYIVRVPIKASDTVLIDGQRHVVPHAAGVGFKIASRNIEADEIVVKYGAPIGSATLPIKTGELVHVDNMKSNYIAIHLNDTPDIKESE